MVLTMMEMFRLPCCPDPASPWLTAPVSCLNHLTPIFPANSGDELPLLASPSLDHHLISNSKTGKGRHPDSTVSIGSCTY